MVLISLWLEGVAHGSPVGTEGKVVGFLISSAWRFARAALFARVILICNILLLQH